MENNTAIVYVHINARITSNYTTIVKLSLTKMALNFSFSYSLTLLSLTSNNCNVEILLAV